MNRNIIKAIDLCMQKNIPFVAYIMPRETELNFFSNPTKEFNSSISFFVNFFADKYNDPIIISSELDAEETIANIDSLEPQCSPLISPHKISTSFENYNSQISKIKSLLESTRGKIVLSRTTCGTNNKINWTNAILKYFAEFPSTFRYLYYTPQTGFWFGASPETLIMHQNNSPTFKSMSLAGTRKKKSANEDWDKKNIEEHNYVTDYIVDVFNSLGLKTIVSPYENLEFGDLEHLCNNITASIENFSPIEITRAISPTPALAGYPVEFAIKNINLIEDHQRYCYGGFVALRDSTKFHSFVNLRCAHFDKNSYCIYSGGGITIDSDAISEWNEAESKISILKQILND